MMGPAYSIGCIGLFLSVPKACLTLSFCTFSAAEEPEKRGTLTHYRHTGPIQLSPASPSSSLKVPLWEQWRC